MNYAHSRTYLLAFLIVGILATTGCNADEAGTDWQAILTAEHRSQQHRDRDVHRNPRQTLAFFEVEPCHTVVEVWPGAGWYTEILAPLLRDCGKLYAAHFNPERDDVAYFRNAYEAYAAKLAASPAIYDRVSMTVLDAPSEVAIAPPGSADRVLTFRSVHGWLRSGTGEEVFAAFYAALKPGGILGVVTHRAPEGTELETMINTGYVAESTVKALAESAGFEYVDSAEINANPLDTADHPKGVWTLPPSLRMGDEDRAKYLAIGESDRMTMKFRKPL